MTELRERAVAFVVARLSSSRLPQKQLRQIGGKSILDWIMDELGACRELDQVVVATVAEPDNVPLRDLAAARGWECFWYDGGVDDVVGRLVAAAHRYDAGICLLISADCPLVHGASVDRLVARFRRHRDADYLVLPPRAPGQVPLLEGVQVARLDAWQRADAMSDMNRPNAADWEPNRRPRPFCFTWMMMLSRCLRISGYKVSSAPASTNTWGPR